MSASNPTADEDAPMTTFQIVRDGYFFRAINEATGFRSSVLTSASQAGKVIEKMAGKDAHRAAAERFLSA